MNNPDVTEKLKTPAASTPASGCGAPLVKLILKCQETSVLGKALEMASESQMQTEVGMIVDELRSRRVLTQIK